MVGERDEQTQQREIEQVNPICNPVIKTKEKKILVPGSRNSNK